VQPLLLYGVYRLVFRDRMEFSVDALPPLWQAVATIVFWFIMMDFWFYWTHRGLHYFPQLYGRIHKKHHKFNITVGVAAGYAHPLEDIFVNALSTGLGPFLFPSHFVVYLIYMAIRINETLDAHSGYAFPWSLWTFWDDRARRHDFHHSDNRGNYGAWRFWDWLTGTDAPYREFLAKKAAASAASALAAGSANVTGNTARTGAGITGEEVSPTQATTQASTTPPEEVSTTNHRKNL